jgi:hypothetical protein
MKNSLVVFALVIGLLAPAPAGVTGRRVHGDRVSLPKGDGASFR